MPNTGTIRNEKKIQAHIHIHIHNLTIRAEPTLVKYYYVLAPTNSKLLVNDHYCSVFAEI